MFNLISALLNNLGYIIVIAFLFTRIQPSRNTFVKENYNAKDIFILSLFFGGLAIIGTYSGIDFKGSIANTRNIGVITGGLLVSPWVGIVSGIIAGIHRFFLLSGEFTAVPCSISTIIGGFFVAYLSKFINEQNKYVYGFFAGFVVENLSMFLIYFLSGDRQIALEIIQTIYLPMILANALGVPIVIIIIESIIEEKEIMAGKQAKLSLEIAEKTLPYFSNGGSLNEVCKIIMNALEAKCVVLSNEKFIVGSHSYSKEYEVDHTEVKSEAAKKVLSTGKIFIANRIFNNEEFNCVKGNINSYIIVPLYQNEKVFGTLKVYFDKFGQITESKKNLIEGLSKLISTQLELTKIENFKAMARDANFKMLQTQINPHFLFNALNTISSFIRINPEKARDIILNLSTILRFNLENFDKLVTVSKEIEQVKAYINIEQARFNNKIKVNYSIEEEVENFQIPSLIIQPLVENSIKHGILPKREGGTVSIEINKIDNSHIKITVQDDGVGIPQEVINSLNNSNFKSIGLKNVHDRLKLLYGKGLEIKKLENGTRISFDIQFKE